MGDVLFLSNANRFELTPMVEGTISVIRRQHWNLRVIGDLSSRNDVRRALDIWKPIGCIVQNASDTAIFRESDFGAIPLVFIDRALSTLSLGRPTVTHDSAAAGRLAAQTLLALGLPHHAYARVSRKVHWCREREDAFVGVLAAHGMKCLCSPDLVGDAPAIDPIESEKRALKWLVTLPRPIAIFAANDGLAEVILKAGAKLRLNTPQDMAVLGVDDVRIICENTIPTLSSIHPDFAHAGMLASEILSNLVNHRKVTYRHVKYGQAGVVHRQSTRRLPTVDAILNKVLEFIRTHAADPSITISDISRIVGVSRRTIELHFRKMVGHGILDEIHAIRIQLAQRSLTDSAAPISEVCSQSGFRSFATFSRIFVKLTGVSPKQYRRQHRQQAC